jgi:hypothetical protein
MLKDQTLSIYKLRREDDEEDSGMEVEAKILVHT